MFGSGSDQKTSGIPNLTYKTTWTLPNSLTIRMELSAGEGHTTGIRHTSDQPASSDICRQTKYFWILEKEKSPRHTAKKEFSHWC